jgi:hypothetical protein
MLQALHPFKPGYRVQQLHTHGTQHLRIDITSQVSAILVRYRIRNQKWDQELH